MFLPQVSLPLQTRFLRAIIVGAVAGTLISLCTIISQILID